MASKRTTYPHDPNGHADVFERAAPPAEPDSMVEAVMQARPFEPIEETVWELQERLEPLRDALDVVLDERETWVIEGLFWRQIGLRKVAAELGLSKTHIARIRDAALAKLYNYFEGEY